MHRLHLPLFVAFIALAVAGCDSTLSITTIQLGRSLNEDKTVATHTTTFKPGETVYVSVLTDGVGSGTIRVKWIYGGQVVGQPTKEVKGAAATEFQLQSAGGFPPGEYTVEVFLNEQSAGTRTFRVEGTPEPLKKR